MGTWQGRTALILSGAPETRLDYVRRIAAEQDCVILCADSGVRQLDKLGLSPDLVVGDFDSADCPSLDCEIVRLIPEKDDTDTMHALSIAIDRGCTDAVLVCATGGRIDHMLCNFSLCEYAAERGCSCRIVDPQNELFLLTPGLHRLENSGRYPYFSIIPLDRILEDVSISGAKYPLKHAQIRRENIYSVSNEWTSACAVIEIGRGSAYCVLSSDRPV